MVQERPSTPEKQLLKLIEDPGSRDLSHTKIKRASSSLFSLAALRGRLSFWQESIRSGSFFKKTFFDIKGINRVLRVCVIVLFFYTAGHFTFSMIRLREIPEFAAKRSRAAAKISADETSDKKISYYLEGPRSRDIFKFGDFSREDEEELKEEVAAPVEETISPAETLARQLGLVGIGWSEDPDVMVENVETKKIYFLKRGQRIDNLIRVEAIFQDRVILTYDNGKEMELR